MTADEIKKKIRAFLGRFIRDTNIREEEDLFASQVIKDHQRIQGK